jgi:metal-sulfur cluster biosynthetic enzyme
MVAKEEVLDVLKNVYDPEIMMNIVDIGLIYRVDVNPEKIVIEYTLTYPGCPVGDMISNEIVTTVQDFSGIKDVEAKLVWDPPWSPERMSEEARISMGYPI